MIDQNKRSKAKKRDSKARFLSEFGQAIAELNDILAGSRQAQDAYDLLDTLDCIARRSEPMRPFNEVKSDILISRKA